MGVKRDKGILKRSKEFLAINIWALWLVVGLNALWSGYSILENSAKLDGAVNHLKKTSAQLSNGIVMLDILGRPVVTQTTLLTPMNPAFKEAIANYVKMYAVYDWARITNNFAVKVFSKEDVYAKNEDVKVFRDEFFEEGKQAKKDFDAYVTKVVFALNNNRLPENISVAKQTISKFSVEDGRFTMELSLLVTATIYDGNTEKYKIKEGTFTIEMEGFVNPSVGNLINPLGIKFSRHFQVVFVEK